MKPIAVIGAGIAGLSAAHVLTRAGIPVVVFDKSRAVGGRMATRRIEFPAFDHAAFDHGAQYFKATTQLFRDEIAAWVSSGVAAAWGNGEGDARFVGVPDMTAPARVLGDGLAIVLKCTVTALSQTSAATWELSALEGPVIQPSGGFGGVILAIPAPQATIVLAASDLLLPGVETATYAPCWALMVACATPITGLDATLRPASDVIAWIATNSAKPQRATTPACYIVHATAAWSRAHLELDRETARDLLLAELVALTGADLAGCVGVAHRWRYALVDQPFGQPFLFNAQSRIGACGDWCLGPRIEDAWLSGRALGLHLAKFTADAT